MIESTQPIKKLHVTSSNPCNYFWVGSHENISINSLIGKPIKLSYTNQIFCTVCGSKTKKSFMNGFCFRCFQTSPESSPCIINPEKCEAHLGKGRDVNWEKDNHFQPHIVYLSYTGNYKVGVTRKSNALSRWIDQGATQASIIAQTPYRQLAGLIEVALKSFISDKTSWQAMLKNGNTTPDNFKEQKINIISKIPPEYTKYIIHNSPITSLEYPLTTTYTKIKSVTFDKQSTISATLSGIKGQYFLFDEGYVFNVRRHTGYNCTLTI